MKTQNHLSQLFAAADEMRKGNMEQQDKKTKFVREERYIVIKISKLHPEPNFRAKEIANLKNIASGALVDCAVVEADWPEYEPTWKAIEKRVQRETCIHEWKPWQVAGEGGFCANCGLRDMTLDI